MINAQIYTETIGANSTVRRLFQGEFFKIISCTGAINVRTRTVNLNALVAGQGFEKAPFEYLEMTDASAASNTIRYIVATDGFLDGITGAMQITSNVPPVSASFANTLKTVTSTTGQLVAANSARKYFMVQNKDPAGFVYLNFGAGAATIANGIRIQPGGVYEMSEVQSTQAIQAIGDIASNTNVLVVEG